MDSVWIAVAFALGFLAQQVGLPPLIGYLVAGFALGGLDLEGGELLGGVVDLGVYLLLFTIGLKLRLRGLARPEILVSSIVHMLLATVSIGLLLWALSGTGLPVLSGLDLGTSALVAFALSFSSTVFALKVFEHKGETASLHARTAVGILVVQDIVAVVFLTVSTGKFPSLWALAVPVALLAARPLLRLLVKRCGHGELLVLFGLAATIGGVELFRAVGLKPDLGALVARLLLSGHRRAGELSETLLSLKDLLLLGFFLDIGLSSEPTIGALVVASSLVLLVPLKGGLFFLLLTRLRLRPRTSLMASLGLSNFSEFGLIVAAVAARQGWIGPEWLAVLAVAVSVSFLLASPLNARAGAIHARLDPRIRPLATRTHHPEEEPIELGSATVIIVGMGRIGAGAYDALRERYGREVLGVDFDPVVVGRHVAAGRRVVQGDGTDLVFWEKAPLDRIRLVMLAAPDHLSNIRAARQLNRCGYGGEVAAVAGYEEDAGALRAEGVDAVFDVFSEAGTGFADHVCSQIERSGGPDAGQPAPAAP